MTSQKALQFRLFLLSFAAPVTRYESCLFSSFSVSCTYLKRSLCVWKSKAKPNSGEQNKQPMHGNKTIATAYWQTDVWYSDEAPSMEGKTNSLALKKRYCDFSLYFQRDSVNYMFTFLFHFMFFSFRNWPTLCRALWAKKKYAQTFSSALRFDVSFYKVSCFIVYAQTSLPLDLRVKLLIFKNKLVQHPKNMRNTL